MNGLSQTSTIPDDGPAADAEPPSRLSVDVVAESDAWPDVEAAVATVERAAEALASSPALSLRRSQATISLSDDQTLRSLNARFRGVDKPTNVLSFPAAQTPFAEADAPVFLGDVAIAAETVIREAAERDVTVEHHLAHLTVHGLLHLLGYDHDTDAAASEMEALETAVLVRIGFPDPYAAD